MSEVVAQPLPTSGATASPSPQWLAAARRARFLSWLSLIWMGLEGGIAIVAGVLAGSIALIGFGIDSAIEGVASVVIIWRFTGERTLSHAAEERAQKLVAIAPADWTPGSPMEMPCEAAVRSPASPSPVPFR